MFLVYYEMPLKPSARIITKVDDKEDYKLDDNYYFWEGVKLKKGKGENSYYVYIYLNSQGIYLFVPFEIHIPRMATINIFMRVIR